MKRILKSYFYWTYPRGSFHYDVMVSLILAFIFITPHLWNYGDKPTVTSSRSNPVLVTGDGGYGVIVTLAASEVSVPAGATNREIKKSLKKAMEPVLGDSMNVERWEVERDGQGNPVDWKIWAHR
jgi:hypothetical protein